MQKLSYLTEKSSRSVLGLMSGTSCDGLDIAQIEINGSGLETQFTFQRGKSYAYTQAQKETILRAMQPGAATPKTLSQLNFYLAHVWSEMINRFMLEHELVPEAIDFIGSHGQTIWHQPNPEGFADRSITSTLQLGDPSVLANLTNITVIGDFRVADMALGGQGAPLIPFFDWIFFSRFQKNILALNIGGISNATFVPDDGDFNKLIAFDCGPGNMLIDQLTQDLFDRPYDKDAAIATQGSLNTELFNYLKRLDAFVEQTPPKSTGREYYGNDFVAKIKAFAGKHAVAPEDIIHTVSEWTVYAVHRNYEQFILPQGQLQNLAVGGGGAHNPFIMRRLQDYFKDAGVSRVKAFDLNEDFKEAIGFAVMANETVHGQTSNVAHLSGASRPAILGKICLV